MSPSPKTLRTCPQGHTYYKSSDCPTCPTCETLNAPTDGFLSKLSAPARRAFQNKGITTLEQLAKYSEKEILELHGVGPTAIPRLKEALREKGLTLKSS